MAALGSLRVELELEDGSFTTRVIRAGTTMQQLENQVGRTIIAVRRLDSSVTQAGGVLRDFVVTLGLARAAVENFATVFAGLPVSILRTAGEIERLTVLLRGLSTATDEAGRIADGQRATAWIMDLAQRAPFALESLTQTFVRLRAGGIDPLNGSMQGLVDAVAAFGGSREQLERAGVAIQQMAGKGVISMEELRQQLGEAVPTAIPLMARALGVSVDQLVEKIAQGRVRAEPALQALSDEFARTFGGAALRQMDTFRGQLQVLQTQWQRLQLAAAGRPGSGGFLDAATNALRMFNEALKSPDMQGFAIRVGQVFRDITNTIVYATQFVHENAEAFKTLGMTVAVIGGWMLLRSVVLSLGVAFNVFYMSALNPIRVALVAIAVNAIPVTIAAFGALTLAINTLAAAMARTLIASIAVTRILGVFGALQLAATALAASISGAFYSAIGGLVAVLGRADMALKAFAGSMMATGAAVNVFRFAMWGLIGAGVFGAIVIGMELIGRAIDWLRRKFNNITADSGAAFERLRQGAADTATIMTATQEVADFRAREAEITTARATIDRFRRQGRAAPLDALQGDDARGVARSLTRRDLAAVEEADRRLAEIQQRIAAERAARENAIAGANSRRQEQLSNIEADTRMRAIERTAAPIIAAYDRQASDVAAARRQVEANAELSPEAKAAQLTLISEESLNAQKRLAERLIAEVYQKSLDDARAALVAANEANDEPAQNTQRQLISRLEAEITRVRELAQRAGVDFRDMLTLGGNDTIINQANTRIENMRLRIAQLNEEAQGSQGQFARITELLRQGDWAALPQATKEQMLDLARRTDEAAQAVENFRKRQRAVGQIDEAMANATRDLERYSAAISDPTLPEAQRAFANTQALIARALADVARATGGVGDAFMEAASKAVQATQIARSATLMSTISDLTRQADQARLRGLSASARAAEELAQLRTRVATARVEIAQDASLTETQRAARRAELDAAARTIEQGITRAGDAPGGRAQESALARLRGRIAELSDEIRGGNGEWAKLRAQLGDTQAATAAGQAQLALAAQVDELAAKAERARAAWNALQQLQQRGAEGAQQDSEYGAALRDPNGSEISRQYASAEARGRAAIAALQETGMVAMETIERERARLIESLSGLATGIAGREALQMRDATRTIRTELATTNEERRRLAFQAVEIEREAQQRMIDLARVSAERRAELEANLQDYIAARREQAARQTEGPFRKMMRDWSNISDNIEQAFTSSFDRMSDALTEFVMTGKANFADLAKAILADITKIAIRAAASGIFNMIFGGAGAGVNTAGLSKPSALGASGGTKAFHAGGVLGMDAPTFTRMLDYSLTAGIRRLHTGGLAGDEELTILQKGEGVFTEGQMAVIGRMNSSYQMMEASMAQLASAIPDGIAPPDYAMAPSARPAAPPVTINMKNESGSQIEAFAGPPQMDIDGMVIDVVLRNAQRPGPLRDMLRGG